LAVLNPFSAGLVLLMLFGVLLAGVSVLKVWRSTPAGFRPQVRISLLDYVQSWSLRRSAEKSLEAGDKKEALRSYMSASQNNLGDVELLRRALQSLVSVGGAEARAMADRVTRRADWLLLLSGTNQSDLHLVARVYDAVGDSRAVLRLLDPDEREIPEGLYGAMAKAMFDTGDASAFGDWWQRVGEERRDDPDLELYHSAWLAGWGPESDREAHLAELTAATENLDKRMLANRLLLRVALQRRDLDAYGEALGRLEGFQGDRMADHVDYWKMLFRLNRQEEALQLALNHPYPPRQALEAAQYALALTELGDAKSARRVLEQYGPTLGDGPAVFCLPLWALLSDLYIADEAWSELAQMGKDLRSLPYGSQTMSGFGWFAEGRATVGRGERALAGEMFDAAVEDGFSTLAMNLEVASVLLTVGYPEQAQRLLLPLEDALDDRVRYWQLLFEAAYAIRKDEALLFKAARKALDLEPDSPLRRVNYAVALLLTRQRPQEAVRLTLEFAGSHQGPLALLNHAHALAMVGRGAEAAQILEKTPVLMDPELRTGRALVALEIGLVRGDDEAAREALAAIEEQFLFPTQVEWLKGVRQRLGTGS
jgi:hypothetical protein